MARFFVDHCVPASVARRLSSEGHEAWTAHEAHLEDAPDEALIAYSSKRNAILVTTNRDCAALARRMRSARVIHLRVREVDAEAATGRALAWLSEHALPAGRVLRVPKTVEPEVLRPERL